MNVDIQKSMLRPLRLVRFGGEQLQASVERVEESNVRNLQSDEEAKAIKKEAKSPVETLVFVPGERHANAMLTNITEAEIPLGETGARYLLKRTPTNYLLNQAYGLWVFISLF